MSKKDKKIKTDFDFDIGIGEIIPSTQEAYQSDGFSSEIRKEEKTGITKFKQIILQKVGEKLKDTDLFPSDDEVFVFIFQYFASEKEYRRRDIDNISKTILDVLRGTFYHDDSQVRTLLVGKKIEPRVPQNFAYVAIKLLSASQDVDALKISGLERSVTMFQELKSKKVL